MYDLKSNLFVHEGYVLFPDAIARVERVEAAMGKAAQTFGDLDIPDLIEANNWATLRSSRFGEQDNPPEPDVVLMLARFDGNPNAEKVLDACGDDGQAKHLARYLLGGGAFSFFSSGIRDWTRPRKDHVCRPAWRLSTMNGCPHLCAYCSFGGVHMAMVNLDHYAEHLRKLINNNPWEPVYLFNDASDTLVLEPEIDNVRFFIYFFKSMPDRYFVVHTKSANVDHMLGHDHQQRCIMLWTIASPTASRVFEPGAPTTEERFEAARKCYQAGYPVRIKFKPIIPVKNWREEAKDMARRALDGMRPELINLFTLSWMSVDEMVRAFDVNQLDPEIVAAAEAAKEEMKDSHVKPLPHKTRAIIYDHFITEIRKVDPDVPVTFSTETLDMWKEFGPRLGYKPTDYICGCGAQARPGCTRLEQSPWAVCKPVTWDGAELPLKKD